eukprot:scaffold4285_cov66-Attheya_sp.AAC.2
MSLAYPGTLFFLAMSKGHADFTTPGCQNQAHSDSLLLLVLSQWEWTIVTVQPPVLIFNQYYKFSECNKSMCVSIQDVRTGPLVLDNKLWNEHEILFNVNLSCSPLPT